MNHHMNPIEDFDYFTILRGEGGGVLLVEGTSKYKFNSHAVRMDSRISFILSYFTENFLHTKSSQI